MTLISVTQAIAFGALTVSVAAFAWMWRRMQQRPFGLDRSAPKDTAARGIRYAFTTGMAPWAKESTRIHRWGYLRGVVFHVGIFVALAALLLSPWLEAMSGAMRFAWALLAALGAAMGVVGGIARVSDRTLRALSTRDDHASVWLVSLVLLSAAAAVVAPDWLPVFYILSSVLLLYAPASKIRHCIYVYFGRLFFGIHIGRRGIVHGLEEHHA